MCVGTLVGPIYNIAFPEEVPFDCRNVTRFSHKYCCALFLPQTLWKIWIRFDFGFSIKQGIPPPVTWAHAYGIDSGSMNCGIIKVPVNWKVVFFLTILIVDFSSDPKQTKLISQDYSDGDFQSLILNKQYWFPKNILMVIFSFRSSPLLLSFLKVTPSEIVPFTNWRDSWNLTPERFSCLSLCPSGLD